MYEVTTNLLLIVHLFWLQTKGDEGLMYSAFLHIQGHFQILQIPDQSQNGCFLK